MRAGERAKRAERVHGMWRGERGHARCLRAGERAKRAERHHHPDSAASTNVVHRMAHTLVPEPSFYD
uniref:Uncharacterized protein n=1 Tax=Globodera rostochiensis TaxID=31243 RepID=A0A914H6B1_GLORO